MRRIHRMMVMMLVWKLGDDIGSVEKEEREKKISKKT